MGEKASPGPEDGVEFMSSILTGNRTVRNFRPVAVTFGWYKLALIEKSKAWFYWKREVQTHEGSLPVSEEWHVQRWAITPFYSIQRKFRISILAAQLYCLDEIWSLSRRRRIKLFLMHRKDLREMLGYFNDWGSWSGMRSLLRHGTHGSFDRPFLLTPSCAVSRCK